MSFAGVMGSVGNVLFGKSGYKRQETLDAQQKAARNAELAALGQSMGNVGGALEGYTGEAYNAYNQAQGAEQFGRMRDFLTADLGKNANALSGSNMSRFSRGFQASLGDLKDKYAKNILATDQAQLDAETKAKQDAYNNHLAAIGAVLTGNNNMLTSTNKIQNTQGMGILPAVQGTAQTVEAVKKAWGSGGTA